MSGAGKRSNHIAGYITTMATPRVLISHNPRAVEFRPRRQPRPKLCNLCLQVSVAVSRMGYHYCPEHLERMAGIAGEAGVKFEWKAVKFWKIVPKSV